MNCINHLAPGIVAAAVALVLTSPAAVAQSLGKGGGGGPPPDPAVAYVGSRDGSLYVMNADGSNQTRILSVAHQDSVRGPTWSPDGTQIVLWGQLGGICGIYTIAADGSGLQRIVTLADQDGRLPTYPDWSPAPTPDGTSKIVFTDGVPEYGGAYRAVYVCNLDGSGITRVTQGPNSMFHTWACWTRDATGIVASKVGQELHLFPLQVGSDGALQVAADLIIHQGGDGYFFPKAASDHDWIVVSTRLGGVGTSLDLVIFDISDPFYPQISLVFDSGWGDRSASFSPDDSQLAFHVDGPGQENGIAQLSLGAPGTTILTSRGFDPNWQR